MGPWSGKKNIGDWGPSRRTAGQVTFAHRKKCPLTTTFSIDTESKVWQRWLNMTLNKSSQNWTKVSISTTFREMDTETPKTNYRPRKNDSTIKMNAIFEISALENPRVPNFIKIGQLLVFGHFLGDPPPKNVSFWWKKNSDQNFEPIFVLITFENLCIQHFSKLGWHLNHR